MNNLEQLKTTADRIEDYTEKHLFDQFGLMMSTIDSHTGKPFERDFLAEEKVPRRALFDPWSWWTYEDTIMTSGHYIEGLVMKYELEGDKTAIERAERVMHGVKAVYYQSQAYGGSGAFLRPYGAFSEMEKFGEPLGTDQAAPLFCGMYRLLPHVSDEERCEMEMIMIKSLQWYADQNYGYRYYKYQQHYWRGPNHHHASSYYLPAIAFAAKMTGEKRWKDDLVFYLEKQLHDIVITEMGTWRKAAAAS